MSALKVLVTVALLGFLVVECLGVPMCTPDQWQGRRISHSGFVRYGLPGTFQSQETIFYDAKGLQKSRFVSFNDNGKRGLLQIVEWYDKTGGGVSYTVDMIKGTCYASQLIGYFPKSCIPDGAKLVDSYHLGLKKDGMVVSTYKFSFQAPPKRAEINSVVLHDGAVIVPIAENVFGNNSGIVYFESAEFGDIETKITNTSVFDMPAQCKQQEQDVTILEHFMKRPHLLRP